MGIIISGLSRLHVEDAASQLRADHRDIEECFSRYYAEENEARWAQLIQAALVRLQVHLALEEELFYPAFLRARSADEPRATAVTHHVLIKSVITALEHHDPGDHDFERKVHVLWSLTKSHMTAQERQGGLLDASLLTEMDLFVLGQQMTIRREELEDLLQRRRFEGLE